MMRKLAMWLLRRSPATLPKGRDIAFLVGLPPAIMDAAYMTCGQCEKFDTSGENRRHHALRALLNQGYKERDAAMAIEIAIRIVT